MHPHRRAQTGPRGVERRTPPARDLHGKKFTKDTARWAGVHGASQGNEARQNDACTHEAPSGRCVARSYSATSDFLSFLPVTPRTTCTVQVSLLFVYLRNFCSPRCYTTISPPV